MGRTSGRDQTVLGQVSTQGVDHLGALADKHLPCPKQHRAGLLIFRLHGDETHGRTQRRLNDCLGISHVVFLAPDERLHIDRRNEAHVMSELLKLPAPAVRRRTGFHGNKTSWLRRNESEQPSAGKLLSEHNRPVVTRPVQLEDPLCQNQSR